MEPLSRCPGELGKIGPEVSPFFGKVSQDGEREGEISQFSGERPGEVKTDQLEGREGRRIMNRTHKSTISLDAQDCKKLKWKGRPRSQSKQSGSQNSDSWESKLTDTSSYSCAHSRRKDVIENSSVILYTKHKSIGSLPQLAGTLPQVLSSSGSGRVRGPQTSDLVRGSPSAR